MKEDTRSRDRQADRVAADKRRNEGRTDRSGRDNPNLYPLRDLDDYKVASDDPDVRGWNVISGDNEEVGKVDELIVDTKRMKVRYLVVDVDDKFSSTDNTDNADHYMLIPIGAARLHEKNNDVVVSNITTDNFANYPPYSSGGRISRDHEQSIRRFYEAGGTGTTTTARRDNSSSETIRDAHTGKIYERQGDDLSDRSSASGVDSNSRNRVDVVSGKSGDIASSDSDRAHGTGKLSNTPEEDRMKDRDQASSNTMRRDFSAEDRRPDNKTEFGAFNHTDATDIRDRIGTSGISSSRTSNLPNKDLEQGPTNKEVTGAGKSGDNMSESDRVRIHDTDPNVETPRGSREGDRSQDFNSTSDLNRSTSKGDDSRRGSNIGNQESREHTPGIKDRSRMSSPEFTDRTATPGDSRHPDKYPEGSRPANRKDLEHTSDELPDDRYDPENDEFYTHEHFDEDRFYGNRRNRDKK